MAITYTWEFPSHKKYTQRNGHANVVTQVTWRLYATDGTHHEIIDGTVELKDPEPGAPDFVSLDQITKADVQNWVESILESRAVDGSEDGPVCLGAQYYKDLLATRIQKKVDAAGSSKPVRGSFNF